MFYFSRFFTINVYLTLLLALVSIAGDQIVAHSKLHLFQAVFDNATHGLIGGLSWLFVCVNVKNLSHTQNLMEIASCAVIASVIDIDHFVAARSFNLKDATSLEKRPALHCSTFPLGVCLIVVFWSYLGNFEGWKRGSLIVLTAFVSHHTRDATRRGYWFYPLGSTPPLPYFLYIGVTCFFPYLICLFLNFITSDNNKYHYDSLVQKGAVI